MTAEGGEGETAKGRAGRGPVLTVLGIALCAAFPALSLAISRPDALWAPAPLAAACALALLFLAPGLSAVTVAIRGLGTVARDFAARPDSEHEQILVRIAFGAVVYAYTLLFLDRAVDDPRILVCFFVVASGITAAWLLLLHIVLHPAPARWRRILAMLHDVALLSAFLHLGGELTAAWYPVYLWVTLGYGFRFGLASLLLCGSLSVIGFAAVLALTPFWRGHLLLGAGLLLALIVLPAYVSRLIRSLTEAKGQAEAANAAKSRFLAIISHELRTPLNTIIGMSSLIEKGPLAGEQKDFLKTIQLAARTLLGLINDILDFSKIEAGKFQPQTESFDLYDVAQSAIAMLRAEAAEKGLQVALRIDPAVPDTLRGWPHQLRQVLINLLANAVKFTAKGRVALTIEQLGRQGRTAHLRFVVRDQGIGIPAEALDKIFDIFTQADEAVTRRYGGAGLGLAIVKQLVTLMGGTIAVESTVGKGSAFSVELPFEFNPAAPPRPLDLAGRVVLIVSPEEAFPAALEPPLQQWEARPIWIGAGDAALQALDEASPLASSVVVIDGRGDAVAALSAAYRLAAHPALSDPAILFVAEAAETAPIAALAEPRFAAVLPAPLEDAVLANALRSLPLVAVAEDAPAAEPAREASTERSVETMPIARRLRVLVAEDNSANRKIIQRILEMVGHEVRIVHDGEAALTALDAEAFDVALLDINMPEMSGYEATKLYRMMHLDGPHLPIIALTADGTAETEALCREAGMDAVLTKPVEPERLIAAIEKAVVRDGAAGGEGSVAVPARTSVVTPISAHPKFLTESGTGATVIDEAAIEALRALGAGSDFFEDVIRTFRSDARQILEFIAKAVASADVRAFREHAHSLRSSAANVGGARLCEALMSLREVSAKQLRQEGPDFVERLYAEFQRLDVALETKLQEAARR